MDTPNAVDKNTLLSAAKVCRAIANKVCPPYDSHIKGIDCIVGGLVEIQIGPPAKPSGNLEQIVWQPSNAPEPVLGQQTSYSLPFVLSKEHKEWIIKHVPNLSNLHFPYSKNSEEIFLETFERLEGAPNWRPVLLSRSDVDRRKRDHDDVCDSHFRKFQALVKQGKLRAVTQEYLPVENLTLADFVIAQDVADYCRQCGIEIEIDGTLMFVSVDEKATQKSSGDDVFVSAQEAFKRLSTQLDVKQFNVVSSIVRTTNHRHKDPLSDETKQKIIDVSKSLKDHKFSAFTTLTAQIFGISDRMVRKVVEEMTVFNTAKSGTAHLKKNTRNQMH